jgi:hypothetical protein
MTVRETVDTLRVVRDYLLTHTADLTPILGADLPSRIRAHRLQSRQLFPAVRVVRVTSATQVDGWFWADRVQVDCWSAAATDDHTSWRLASTCRRLLSDLPGYPHPEGHVTAVREVTGIQPIPEPDADRTRHTFEVRIFTHPHIQ